MTPSPSGDEGACIGTGTRPSKMERLPLGTRGLVLLDPPQDADPDVLGLDTMRTPHSQFRHVIFGFPS